MPLLVIELPLQYKTTTRESMHMGMHQGSKMHGSERFPAVTFNVLTLNAIVFRGYNAKPTTSGLGSIDDDEWG